MIEFGLNNLQGILACFLVFFCNEVCICQRRDLRPSPGVHRPRPTTSLLYRAPIETRHRFQRLASSATPDQRPRSTHPPKIHPSVSRGPTPTSRTTKAPILSQTHSNCSMLKPDKDIRASIPLQANLVAIKLDRQYQGAWKFSFDNRRWNSIRCQLGQVLVLSIRNFIRFEPHVGFHGAVKFRASEFKGMIRVGSCVSMTTKPKAQHTVAVVIPPKKVPFSFEKVKDKTEINEDEIDKRGEKLSELFAITNRTQLVVDKASLDCIPVAIKEHYLAQIKESNTNARPALAMIQAPDLRLGTIEYRLNQSFPWRPLPLFVRSSLDIHSYPLPLDAFVRFIPLPNVNGKTLIQVVPSAVIPRAEPNGFKELGCARIFLKEMDKKNYVYGALVAAVYKAFEKAKENGAVTIDRMITSLQQLSRTADTLSLVHFKRAVEILGKVKEICEGRLDKLPFFKWYNKTVAPHVRKTPCEMIHGSSICLYSTRAIELPIHIKPIDDQPTIEEPRVYFSPIPDRLDSTYEQGVPTSMLMKVDQMVIKKLIFGGKSDIVRKIMAKGSNPDSLIGHLPKHEQRTAYYQKRKCAQDNDGDELGMAILGTSPSIRNETFGRWLFKKLSSLSWVPLKKAFQNLTSRQRRESGQSKPVALVKPGDRLKFETHNPLLWDNADAQEFTRLDFHAWEGNDNRNSGVQYVDFNASSARFSNRTSSMIATRLGCNGMPGSMAKHDSCGICLGKDECVGCDGVPNSGAKTECGVCYGGRTGIRKPQLDCGGGCNTSYVDECGECQSWSKLKKDFKDCAGTCMRTSGFGARINKCKVCVGGVTGKPENSGMDVCGECRGDNSTCTDCSGTVRGPKRNDDCNRCLDPRSNEFNNCLQITSVSSVTLPSSGPSYVTVQATGIKTAKTAKCVLQNGAQNISLPIASVRMASTTGVSSFYLKIDTVAPGSYSLKCKVDSSATEMEFTKKKLLFYDDGSVVVNTAIPSFALRYQATNVTLVGSGFMNRRTTKCVLEVQKSTFLATFVTIEARFISSSRIMCLVPPRWMTGEFKLGVVFSATFIGMKKTSFSIKSIAPRPISCVLSKQHKVFVRFDQPAAALSRSAKSGQDLGLFSPSTAKLLGSRARCRFKGKELRVSLPPDAPFIESGDVLTLIYREIKNAFGKLTHYQPGISEVNVNCSRPAKPEPVAVELRGARTAGPCQNFKIKAKATGSVRLRYAWTAIFSNKTQNISAALQDDMRNLKRELSKKTQKSIRISKHFVFPNVEYVIEVTVTDVWRQKAKAVMSIIRDNSDAPRIFIAGPKTRKVYLNRKLKLKAFIAGSTLCQKGSERDTAVLYTWSCSSNSVSLSKIDSKILFVNTSQLRPGKQYVFQIMACLANDQTQCSRASVTVVTASKPLECKIKGGKRRSIGEHDQLKLDGRQSNDPDADPKQIQYSWSCEDPDGYTCYYPNKTNPGELIRLGIPDQPVVRINTAEQLPEVNRTYKFSLTVSKGNRSSTCETKIKVERGSPPKIKLFEILKANPDKKIVVRGQVVTEAPDTEYEFSIVEESEEGFAYLDLEVETDLVTTKIKGNVEKPDPRKPARKNVYLIFNPETLAGNATYRIRLTAKYGNTTSYAETDLKTKARPSEGEVLIEPSEGVAANTTFTIASGDGWSVAEEDGPLVYRCGCIGLDRRGKKKSEYFEDLSEKDSCETTLPAGSKAENYTLKCFLEACDAHESCVRSEENVTVTPKKFTAEDFSKTKDTVLEGFNQKDMTKATRAISEANTAAQSMKDDLEGSQGGEKEEEGKQAKKEAFETFFDKGMDFNENGDAQSEDEKSRLKEALAKAVDSADDDSLNKRKNRLSDNFSKLDKAEEREDNGGAEGKRRRRRAVSETKPEVEEKTPEQVEQTLIMYRRIIEPLNFDNDSMTIKEQFLSTLDELGRSMCKGLTTGESPLAAESNVTVLRSEKNSFENVHMNFSRVGCDNCTFYDSNKIAHVLLGKSLKDMYEDWDCVEDGCNGACIVSSQMSDDLLVNSFNENKSRVSEVVYVKLFNPETLVAMTIPQLAMPVTFRIPLTNVTLAQSPKIQCHKWDTASSSWTTTGVSTNAMATEGNQISINCTSSRLGFLAVFEMTSEQSQSTTTSPTTATTVSTASSPTSQTEPTTDTPNPTEVASTTANNEQQQQMQFSFNANYDAVINNNNKASVISTIRTSIASQLSVDPSRIINLSVHPGSIIVQFILLPEGTGQRSVQNLTTIFRNMVQSGSFTVTLSNGQRLDVIRSSFLQGLSIPSITPPPPTVQSTGSNEVKKPGLSQTTLIAIITTGSVFVVIIFAAVVFYCLKKKDQNQKVKATEEEEEDWEVPAKSKNAKGDIPMKGIHNEEHGIEDDPKAKRSEEPMPSLPGTPTYDRD